MVIRDFDWRIRIARRDLHVGYTFMFKSNHCKVISIKPWGFRYEVEGNSLNFMHWDHFIGTNHYISKYRCWNMGK